MVRLRPVPDPRPPEAETLTAGRGWHLQPTDGVRWAYAAAALAYFNPHDTPRRVDLEFELQALSERDVVLEHDGGVVATGRIGPELRRWRCRGITLAPGVNRFVLRSPAAASRDPTAGGQLRSFGAAAMTVRPTEPADRAGPWLPGERVAGREQ
jgi:hypothetical protein